MIKTVRWLRDFTVVRGAPLDPPLPQASSADQPTAERGTIEVTFQARSRSRVAVVQSSPVVLSIAGVGQFYAEEGTDFEFVANGDEEAREGSS